VAPADGRTDGLTTTVIFTYYIDNQIFISIFVYFPSKRTGTMLHSRLFFITLIKNSKGGVFLNSGRNLFLYQQRKILGVDMGKV
jgi:hypothetical protein